MIEFKRTHDGSGFVDPDRERCVGHAEQPDHHVRGVDQRRVRGVRGFVEGSRRVDVSVERDGDDLDARR